MSNRIVLLPSQDKKLQEFKATLPPDVLEAFNLLLASDGYIDAATRTESPVTMELLGRMNNHARSIHSLFGLASEVGELVDNFKKHIFYGKPLDKVNIEEELGDLFWYIALLCDVFGLNFARIMDCNRAKLQARYAAKFTSEEALNRDIGKELSVFGKETTDGKQQGSKGT